MLLNLFSESSATYHAHPAMSASKWKRFAKSPLHYKASLIDNKDSPAMAFGRLCHAIALENGEGYACLSPGYDGRTKEGRAERADAESRGVEVVKTDDYLRAMNVATEFSKCLAEEGVHVGDGITEACCRVRTEWGTVQCRFDLIYLDTLQSYDLKTINDLAKAEREIDARNYDMQDALYRWVFHRSHGVYPPPMRFVFVESSPPHDSVILKADQQRFPILMADLEADLARWHECSINDKWPGMYPDRTAREVLAPAWKDAQGVGELLDSMFSEDETNPNEE